MGLVSGQSEEFLVLLVRGIEPFMPIRERLIHMIEVAETSQVQLTLENLALSAGPSP